MTRAAQVKVAAERLGFDRVGIARAEILEDEGALLRTWLDRGFHGTMGYMARNVEKRIDIQQLLPGAQSVIVGTVNYYTKPAPHDDSSRAKISKYAWGDDYHDIIPEKLEALLRYVQELIPGAAGRYYVDTGPVLEKAWAIRAGVGWLGKHTNVISTNTGSWYFIGVLIVDVELDADQPIEDHCGTCTACIDACPTQAIVEPYVLDASRCISYLTIELKPKHPIPEELATQLDGWVFGCDVCQDVCPWNSFQQPTTEPRFQPRDTSFDVSLDELANLTQKDFMERYAGTPLTRPTRDGLIRNVAAARRP